MHIAIITDPIDNQKAGIHVYTKNMVKNLLKFDKKNTYTLIHKEKHNFYKDTNEIIIKGKGPIYEFYRKLFLIPKTINKLKPDIVIEPAHFGPFRIKKPTKTITIIHDLSNFIYPEFHKLKTNIVHKIFLPGIIKKTDYIITPSNTTKNDINRFFARKKNIFTIHPSINEKEKTTDKRLIEKPYILFIGTIEARKNLNTLIEAYLELKKEKKLKQILLIGGKLGWKNKSTIQKLKNKNIQHLGYISNKTKSNLLNYADCFVFPSFYEGFGIPPLEALSYGIPTITSNAGSLGEIFGNIALTHDPLDKKTLKKQIIRTLEDEKVKGFFKKNGPIFAEKFSAEKNTKELLQLINSIQNE